MILVYYCGQYYYVMIWYKQWKRQEKWRKESEFGWIVVGEWMDGGDGGATSNLGLWYGGHSFQCKSYLCMCY